MGSSKTRAAGVQGGPVTGKPRWKKTQSGNHRLSFHGLTVTVFPNTRRGGWAVSVVEHGGTPGYFNYATRAEARTAAEQIFLERKSSGEFDPPPPRSVREIINDQGLTDGVPSDFAHLYVELTASLERKGERADLYRIELDDQSTALYWL